MAVQKKRFKKGTLTYNLSGMVAKNRNALLAAMRPEQGVLRREILSHTSSTPGGHLHDTGTMRRETKVKLVGGENARVDVTTTDYGIYQHEGYNPWILFDKRALVSRIAQRVRNYRQTGKAVLPRS